MCIYIHVSCSEHSNKSNKENSFSATLLLICFLPNFFLSLLATFRDWIWFDMQSHQRKKTFLFRLRVSERKCLFTVGWLYFARQPKTIVFLLCEFEFELNEWFMNDERVYLTHSLLHVIFFSPPIGGCIHLMDKCVNKSEQELKRKSSGKNIIVLYIAKR